MGRSGMDSEDTIIDSGIGRAAAGDGARSAFRGWTITEQLPCCHIRIF